MLDLFIDNIFVLFGGRVFQQTIDIPMVRIVLRLDNNRIENCSVTEHQLYSRNWN
jgi:hypothetical protein